MSDNVIDFNRKKKEKSSLEPELYVDSSDTEDLELELLVVEFLDEIEEEGEGIEQAIRAAGQDNGEDIIFVELECEESLDEIALEEFIDDLDEYNNLLAPDDE